MELYKSKENKWSVTKVRINECALAQIVFISKNFDTNLTGEYFQLKVQLNFFIAFHVITLLIF